MTIIWLKTNGPGVFEKLIQSCVLEEGEREREGGVNEGEIQNFEHFDLWFGFYRDFKFDNYVT